jgi:uncharacterized protein YjbI with pentapeptide repeats
MDERMQFIARRRADGYVLFAGARFDHANLDGIDLGNAVAVERASFRNSLLSEQSCVPGRRLIGIGKVVA